MSTEKANPKKITKTIAERLSQGGAFLTPRQFDVVSNFFSRVIFDHLSYYGVSNWWDWRGDLPENVSSRPSDITVHESKFGETFIEFYLDIENDEYCDCFTERGTYFNANYSLPLEYVTDKTPEQTMDLIKLAKLRAESNDRQIKEKRKKKATKSPSPKLEEMDSSPSQKPEEMSNEELADFVRKIAAFAGKHQKKSVKGIDKIIKDRAEEVVLRLLGE